MLSKKLVLATAVAALIGAASLAAPQAANATQIVVTAGTLDFDPAGAPTLGDFSGVTLNGTPQLTSLTIDPFTIVDATGTAAGWNVLVTIPDLDDGASHTIATTNISTAAPVVIAGASSNMTGVAGQAVPSFSNAGSKIVVATATNGAGIYHVSPQVLKLTIPQDTIAGTYTSAATIAVVSGP